MPFGSDPLDALVVPDGTRAEERDIVTAGDAVIGGKSRIEFGVRARSVLAGERVRFGGGLEAEADCRLDTWCDVDGNVLVGQDAYLGERVHVAGQLLVNGDLDVGDDATIEEGFEANGFIHIRNPLPLYLFLVIYLTHLLRRGATEDATSFIEAVTDEKPTAGADDADPDPLLIPRKSRVSDDQWEVSTPARIGAGCRLHGNIRAESITVGRETACYGSLRSGGDVAVEAGVIVHGDITARGATVTVAAGAVVKGDIECAVLDVHTDAEVEGRITTSEEVRIRSPIESEPEPDTDADSDADGTDPPQASLEPGGDRAAGIPASDAPEEQGSTASNSPPDPAAVGSVETAPPSTESADATGAEPGTDESEPVEDADGPADATPDVDPPEATGSAAESPDLPIVDAETPAADGDGPDDEPGLAPTAAAIAEIEARHVGDSGENPGAEESPDGLDREPDDGPED